MSIVIVFIIFFGVAIGILIFFLVRMLTNPHRISAVADLLKQGRLPAAQKLAKSILAKDPKYSAAHYYLAKIYLAENKPELALMELKTVNAIGKFGSEIPEIEFRKLISGLYERFGQLEEALKEYILLSQDDAGNADYWYQCARLFADLEKSEVAAKYARRAVELDPRHGPAHHILGMVLYRTKHQLEARVEFEAALRYDSSNYDSYYYLGKLLKESNDYTGALLAFERAQKSPAFKIKALVERGGTYMAQGSYENASIELERAVKLNKDEGSTESLYGRYFLALCYEKLKELDKAIDQWEKIYVKKPQFRDVAEKLTQYQEYRTDDRMKDFLTCSREEFVVLCRRIAAAAMGLAVRDAVESPNGVDFIAIEAESEKWLATKQKPRLLRFLRVADPLDDSAIRSLLENMRKLQIMRGVIITSATFTRTAIEFAENRPVELCDKDQLQEMLRKADAAT